MKANEVEPLLEQSRPELHAYLCKLVIRPQLAEDITQSTFLRAIQATEDLPEERERFRAWLFRVATNLALDELRRHSTWRETVMLDLRKEATSDPQFVKRSEALIGTPETRSIAREHLTVCFACTLRNLPEQRAATLLLKEVHGFSIREMAEILGASEGQIKNWLQESRALMDDRYGTTCALITKAGVCHQCVELDGYFNANKGDPLAKTPGGVDARLEIVKQMREQPWGTWHRLMLDVLDNL